MGVIIVSVCSVSVGVLTGEWDVPAGNRAMCQLLRSRMASGLI